MIDATILEQRLAPLEKAAVEIQHHLGMGGPPASWWEKIAQITDPEAFREAMAYLRAWWQTGGPPDEADKLPKNRPLRQEGEPIMIDETILEQRLAALEKAVAEIQRQLNMLPQEGNWVEKVFPPVRDEEALREAMEYGRAIREADFPAEEPMDHL